VKFPATLAAVLNERKSDGKIGVLRNSATK